MRSWASVLLKGSSTGIPCFIAVHIIVLHRGVFCFVLFCFTNWRQDPPSAKRLWLALLWWSGMNLQYLRGMPVFPFPISHKWSSLTTQFKVQKFTKVFPLLWALNSNFCLLELKSSFQSHSYHLQNWQLKRKHRLKCSTYLLSSTPLLDLGSIISGSSSSQLRMVWLIDVKVIHIQQKSYFEFWSFPMLVICSLILLWRWEVVARRSSQSAMQSWG